MKVYLASAAIALMASTASAQDSALEIVTAMSPQPCGGAIASAEFAGTNDAGQQVIRVTCEGGAVFGAGPFAGAAGAAVPAAIGVVVLGAAFALGDGDSTSSSTGTP